MRMGSTQECNRNYYSYLTQVFDSNIHLCNPSKVHGIFQVDDYGSTLAQRLPFACPEPSLLGPGGQPIDVDKSIPIIPMKTMKEAME